MGFPQALEGQHAGICVQPNQALKTVPSIQVRYPGSECDGDTIASKEAVSPPEGRRSGRKLEDVFL